MTMMKRTSVAVACLSAFLLSGCDQLEGMFDSQEVKTVQKAMAVTSPGEVSVKNWDSVLSHRAMCTHTDWTHEAYNEKDAVIYTCDLKDYDVQLLKAYSHALLKQSALQKEVADLKIELDEVSLAEKQMDGLKAALDEIENKGLLSVYRYFKEMLGITNVDYEALLNGQFVMSLPEPDPEDGPVSSTRQGYIDTVNKLLVDIRATLVAHGIDAKAVHALGLYRSAMEDKDYFAMEEEEVIEYLTFDTNVLKERYESLAKDIAYRTNQQKVMEETTPPVLTSLVQTVVFDYEAQPVKPIYCGITYTVKGDSASHTLNDDLDTCLRMSTEQTWNDDYITLFDPLLPQ